jgi:hypothetical protein
MVKVSTSSLITRITIKQIISCASYDPFEFRPLASLGCRLSIRAFFSFAQPQRRLNTTDSIKEKATKDACMAGLRLRAGIKGVFGLGICPSAHQPHRISVWGGLRVSSTCPYIVIVREFARYLPPSRVKTAAAHRARPFRKAAGVAPCGRGKPHSSPLHRLPGIGAHIYLKTLPSAHS